jgi:dTMP kinase
MTQFKINRLPSFLQISTKDKDLERQLSKIRDKLVLLQHHTAEINPVLGNDKAFQIIPQQDFVDIFDELMAEWMPTAEPYAPMLQPPDPSNSNMDIRVGNTVYYNCRPLVPWGRGFFSFSHSKVIRGKFISLEGLDCSGKSTNIKHVVDTLTKLGHEVVTVRDSGGTPVGEDIRTVISKKRADDEKMIPMTEMLLYLASRAQLTEKIKEELAAGKIVVSDRFSDSSAAYQGYARRQTMQYEAINKVVLKNFEPDHTLYFNVSAKVAEERRLARNKEYHTLNAEDQNFKERCREGYNLVLLNAGERIHQIDADKDEISVRIAVENWVRKTFCPE